MKEWETPRLVRHGTFEAITQVAKDFAFDDGVVFAPTNSPIGPPTVPPVIS
jgi:hypothetical protein